MMSHNVESTSLGMIIISPDFSRHIFSREPYPVRVVAMTFTVNLTGDLADANAGDGVCETSASSGICTFRAAIDEANATAGTDLVTINFEIASSGLQTITLSTTTFPGLQRVDILIDGTTEDGSSCGDLWAGTALTWNVRLDGTSVTASGLTVAGVSTTVGGLDIRNFGTGSSVGMTVSSTGNTIQCNYFYGNGLGVLVLAIFNVHFWKIYNFLVRHIVSSPKLNTPQQNHRDSRYRNFDTVYAVSRELHQH